MNWIIIISVIIVIIIGTKKENDGKITWNDKNLVIWKTKIVNSIWIEENNHKTIKSTRKVEKVEKKNYKIIIFEMKLLTYCFKKNEKKEFDNPKFQFQWTC